jgi:hypothetical protein
MSQNLKITYHHQHRRWPSNSTVTYTDEHASNMKILCVCVWRNRNHSERSRVKKRRQKKKERKKYVEARLNTKAAHMQYSAIRKRNETKNRASAAFMRLEIERKIETRTTPTTTKWVHIEPGCTVCKHEMRGKKNADTRLANKLRTSLFLSTSKTRVMYNEHLYVTRFSFSYKSTLVLLMNNGL